MHGACFLLETVGEIPLDEKPTCAGVVDRLGISSQQKLRVFRREYLDSIARACGDEICFGELYT